MLTLLRENPIAFLGFVLAALIGIMLHEIAHGYVALRNGDNTAKYSNRLNLNPLNHFDVTGAIMFLILGFGYAKPVPINPRNFTNYKKGITQVSVAGVLTNLMIAFISYPLFALSVRYLPDLLMFDDFIIYFLSYSFNVNLWLMVFNLLPIYPLDGFKLVENLSKPYNKYTTFMYRYGNIVLLGFIFVSMFTGFNVVKIVSDFVAKPILLLWGLIL